MEGLPIWMLTVYVCVPICSKFVKKYISISTSRKDISLKESAALCVMIKSSVERENRTTPQFCVECFSRSKIDENWFCQHQKTNSISTLKFDFRADASIAKLHLLPFDIACDIKLMKYERNLLRLDWVKKETYINQFIWVGIWSGE